MTENSNCKENNDSLREDIKTSTAPKPWERQYEESDKAWEAFRTYRDLGTDRSITLVAQKLHKSRAQIGRWSSKFNWPQRVSAWEDEQDRILRQQQISDIKKMRQRHADISKAMLAKAKEALQEIEGSQLKASDISRLVDVASKLERISLGDVGDVVENREGESIADPVVFYMPDDGRNNS